MRRLNAVVVVGACDAVGGDGNVMALYSVFGDGEETPFDMVPCACGCGTQISPYSADGHKRSYALGHGRRGTKLSNEHIKKLVKYPTNDTLFDVIDNEHSAYWLGRLAADGGNYHNIITLSASEKDAENIVKFRDWISPGRPIRIFTQKERTLRGHRLKASVTHAIHVCSKKLATTLIKHGIVPNKTLTLTGPPETVPTEMLRHYYRGYFDSDGSIVISVRLKRGTKPDYHLSLLGTERFLLCFVQWVFDTTGINMSNPHPRKENACWRTEIGGSRRVAIIARLLYGDSTIALDRKRSIATKIIAAHDDRITKNNARKEKIMELRAAGHTVKQIANIVGIAYGTAYCIVHNVRYPQDRKPMVIRLCKIEGCGKRHCAQGYCRRHYNAYARPRPTPRSCTVPECGRLAVRRNLCKTHYRRFMAGQPLQAPIQRSILSKEEEREIIRLYNDEHYSQTDIMKMLGVGENTIARALKRHGIPRRWNRSRI